MKFLEVKLIGNTPSKADTMKAEDDKFDNPQPQKETQAIFIQM
jgi:hypothetical protein